MTKSLNKKTEAKIIEIARELFAKNGFEGTSIRDICKEADVNVSMISYYFGGKKELYEKIVEKTVEGIFNHMNIAMNFAKVLMDFNLMNKNQKVELFFKALDTMIDYFYSDKISDSAIMILFREQMTSGVPLNAEGYKFFKKILASILEKDENDKEVIFRTLTIAGQIHSARIIKQFSLKLMGQDSYSKEDIQMIKDIIKSQTRSTLKDLGAIND